MQNTQPAIHTELSSWPPVFSSRCYDVIQLHVPQWLNKKTKLAKRQKSLQQNTSSYKKKILFMHRRLNKN